jgi:hypothetical protein
VRRTWGFHVSLGFAPKPQVTHSIFLFYSHFTFIYFHFLYSSLFYLPFSHFLLLLLTLHFYTILNPFNIFIYTSAL